MRLACLYVQPQNGFCAGVLHTAYFFVGHEILCECFFLERSQPSEVGLIVGKHAGHQLDIRAVFVCQVAVPCLAEVTATPRPLLLAGETWWSAM